MKRAILGGGLIAFVVLWLESRDTLGQNRPAGATTTFSTATSARYTISIGGLGAAGETQGLQGSVYPDGINHLPGASYQPWQAELWRSDGLPFPRDQNLEIQFEHRDSNDSPMVIVPIELKQGQFSQVVRFLVPSYPNRARHGMGWCHLRVLADGRELPGLRASTWANTMNSNNSKTTTRLPWLIVAEKQKIVSELADEFANDDRQALSRANVQYVSDEYVATTDWLARDWRELTNLESVAIDADAWEKLEASQLTALKDYVYAGGDLFIFGCDENAKSNATVHEWFERIAGSRVNEVKNIGNGREKPRLSLKAEVGFGRVSFSELSLNEVYDSIQTTNYQISTNARTNRLFDVDKMKWLIEKIGRPPVMIFLFSIVVFSLLAGLDCCGGLIANYSVPSGSWPCFPWWRQCSRSGFSSMHLFMTESDFTAGFDLLPSPVLRQAKLVPTPVKPTSAAFHLDKSTSIPRARFGQFEANTKNKRRTITTVALPPPWDYPKTHRASAV